MAKFIVHRWRRYDIATDENIDSRRYGTDEAIEKVCGEIIPGTAIEVDESDLDRNFPGHDRKGLQAARTSKLSDASQELIKAFTPASGAVRNVLILQHLSVWF